MQSVLPSSCKCVLGRSAATQRRPQRATRLACRADGSLNTPSSLIGCHSQVWVGGWDKKDIIKSVEGTKNAGFDLIEGIVTNQADHFHTFGMLVSIDTSTFPKSVDAHEQYFDRACQAYETMAWPTVEA